jgi:hypothetical protein
LNKQPSLLIEEISTSVNPNKFEPLKQTIRAALSDPMNPPADGQAALRPDAVTVELVASVNARTKSMAAVADHLVARAQAATRLMGAAADNIEIFNHRQYLRVNSDAIDKEVRSASLDFDGKIPGRAADTLTPVARGDVSPRQLPLVL